MLVRKLRLDRTWSQETLAEISGLSIRTIQRGERRERASLETRNAIVAAPEVDLANLTLETEMDVPTLTENEREALEYVRDIKGFYTHAIGYAVGVPLIVMGWYLSGAGHPWFIWPALGWGIGLASHGITVFEVFSPFSPDWERRQVEKRLTRRRG
ncbi:MAG: 2TM domain-containing protein [Pseudomonadota bacterium]